MVRKKRARTQISSIQHEGHILTDNKAIQDFGVEFFCNLLTVEDHSATIPRLQHIPTMLSPDEGAFLHQPTTIEEVKRVIFGMCADSVVAPDGFNAFFFQKCWDIIHEDIVGAVQDFLSGTLLSTSITETSIVLIPMVKNPSRWSDYQPISLCNTSNKILTKLFNDRLKTILPSLIVENQSGFVPQR
ncbi:UNVERIFIED_CONTAM: hypothetical protein Slati_4227600 [Sesamum latifolium]|uniref:Reverse transcriptase domain-containing protein n=1 Tax=Sesamum latifolium TaxID=2727402 RepID=A0AAW2TCF7_9LAMI